MFTIRFESSDQRRALQLVRNDLKTEMPKLMELLGIGLLSETQLAYDEKASGGTGSDGVQWPDITRETLAARVGRVGRGKRIIAQRKDLAQQIRQLDQSRPKTRGRGAPATVEGRVAAIKESFGIDKKIDRMRERRNKLRKDFEALVDAAVGNHLIGVDRGLQRASAQPGFMAVDNLGGNILEVHENSVTAGFARKYSDHFDKRRTLMTPELPPSWRPGLEQVAEHWAGTIIQRHF